MRKRKIIVSSADRDRLLQLIDSAYLDSRVPAAVLDALQGELARATIVDRAKVPSDVITMNSTVWFWDLEDEELESYTLVFPHEADVSRDRISVFAPIGTALLGYRVGDLVEWDVPAGRRRLRITQVAQCGEPAELLV
jgi:regulator of nucleoside diphosphate kinase